MRPIDPADSFGGVFVDEDLVELLEPGDIDDAIEHLRMAGGNCWTCHGRIELSADVSLVAHATSVGLRAGFVHFACAPPQLIDDRHNRRAAIRMNGRLADMASTVQGFVALKKYPAPHGLLVVSPESVMRAREQNGDVTSLWFGLVLEQGFSLAAPDLMDVVPDLLEGWTVDISVDGIFTCGDGTSELISAPLTVPEEWRSAVRKEQECVVVACASGISSDEMGSAVESGLNYLASRGLVAYSRVRAGTL